MSYIVRAGNLAGTVRTMLDDDGRPRAFASVIVNDQVRDRESGEWVDSASTAYHLTVPGAAGVHLAEFQKSSGNRRIVFAGDYRVRKYQAPDGTTRLSHDVWAEYVGADFTTVSLRVVEPNATAEPEANMADGGNPWMDTAGQLKEPGGDQAGSEFVGRHDDSTV